MIRTRATACHTKTCARSLGKGTQLAREQARKDRTDQVCGIVEEELMDGRVAEEMMQARRAPRAANLIGTVKRTEEALETEAKDKGQGKGKRDTRYCYDYGEQGHIGMNCPYKWTNSIDEDEQTSWESELDGQEAEEPACLETPDDEGEWCWPRRNKITRWRAG